MFVTLYDSSLSSLPRFPCSSLNYSTVYEVLTTAFFTGLTWRGRKIKLFCSLKSETLSSDYSSRRNLISCMIYFTETYKTYYYRFISNYFTINKHISFKAFARSQTKEKTHSKWRLNQTNLKLHYYSIFIMFNVPIRWSGITNLNLVVHFRTFGCTLSYILHRVSRWSQGDLLATRRIYRSSLLDRPYRTVGGSFRSQLRPSGRSREREPGKKGGVEGGGRGEYCLHQLRVKHQLNSSY